MNLYPFEATVASGAAFDMCVENIDIGGPSMLRSSAKNHAYVAIVTNPAQYEALTQELQASGGCTSLATRKRLAAAAFATSAAYDAHISSYFASQLGDATGGVATRSYQPQSVLKYGCNPHQKPSVIYSALGGKLPFRVINGTPGYINLLDACNAWQLVLELKRALNLPAAASFKHCSPAGAAVGTPLTAIEASAYEIADPSVLTPTALAYVRARNADPMCSFGDFAAISHVVDVATAKVFKAEVCDGIVAPGYEPEALAILQAKKKGAFIVLEADESFVAPLIEFREVYGVTFSQRRNDALFTPALLQRITAGAAPLPEEAQRDLVLASIAIKYTQSNSVRDSQTHTTTNTHTRSYTHSQNMHSHFALSISDDFFAFTHAHTHNTTHTNLQIAIGGLCQKRPNDRCGRRTAKSRGLRQAGRPKSRNLVFAPAPQGASTAIQSYSKEARSSECARAIHRGRHHSGRDAHLARKL